MQCIILAAGRGTRMRPITDTIPKPLVKVAGIPLIEHIVSSLPEEIDSLVMVAGYLGDQIQDYCGDMFCGRSVTYVYQENVEGTASALALCKDMLEERFLVMLADDLHGKEALKRALQHDRCALACPSEHPERFGVIEVGEGNIMKSLVEKPDIPRSNLVSTGVMVLDKGIFNYELVQGKGGEYYLPDLLNQYAQDAPVVVEMQDVWIPVGYPEDIKKAEAYLAGIQK